MEIRKEQICAIIKDLLPQYIENECSEETRTFVEAHLEECDTDCKRMLEHMREPLSELGEESIDKERQSEPEKTEASGSIAEETGQKTGAEVPEITVAQAFRKTKRRMWMRIIAAVLVVVLCLPVIQYGRNEWNKEGRCFSNREEIGQVEKLLELWKNEHGYMAAKELDYTEIFAAQGYDLSSISKMKQSILVSKSEDIKKPLIDVLKSWDMKKIRLVSYEFDDAWSMEYNEKQTWNISYRVSFSNGMTGRLVFNVAGWKIALINALDSDRGLSSIYISLFGADPNSSPEEVAFFQEISRCLPSYLRFEEVQHAPDCPLATKTPEESENAE